MFVVNFILSVNFISSLVWLSDVFVTLVVLMQHSDENAKYVVLCFTCTCNCILMHFSVRQ